MGFAYFCLLLLVLILLTFIAAVKRPHMGFASFYKFFYLIWLEDLIVTRIHYISKITFADDTSLLMEAF